MIAAFSGRYGKRGAWLIVLGTAWAVFGVGVFLDPLPTEKWVLYQQLPTVVQAAGWWITGALAIQQGLRGPDRSDWAGHVGLYLMPAVRLVSFALAWFAWLVSTVLTHWGVLDHAVGYEQGWYAASLWALFVLMLALAASWPNPEAPIPSPPASALDQA